MTIFDDILLKIDNATDLYGKLKALDNALGDRVRNQLREDFGDLDDWQDLLLALTDPFSPTGISHPADFFTSLLSKQNGFAKADLPYNVQALVEAYQEGQKRQQEKKQPVVKAPDITVAPLPDPIKDKNRPSGAKPVATQPAARKIPPLYQPGVTKTKKVPPITAETQIANKYWGELLCYGVEETLPVAYIPPQGSFDTSSLDGRAKQALDGLISHLAVDSMPIKVSDREQIKASLGYWAASAWVGTKHLQGLSGDVSLIGGSESILNLARALSILSLNAYVGFEAVLGLEIAWEEVSGGGEMTRNYSAPPVLAGRSPLKQEAIALSDKDFGYFMGIPWAQRNSRALVRQSNLQILFYAKEKPPYGSGANRIYPSEINIADPRPCTWETIKSACEPYMAGPTLCTVPLANGRKLSVWAKDKEEGKAVLQRMADLSSSPISGGFTYTETEDAGKPVRKMFPGHGLMETEVTDGEPQKAKFLLWVEKEEDANYLIT